MGKINWARVFLGGLLAGVIINVFEFVTNGVFLAAEWETMMKALGRTTFPGPGGALIFLIWGFLSGIGVIWLYAAVRPRFGRVPHPFAQKLCDFQSFKQKGGRRLLSALTGSFFSISIRPPFGPERSSRKTGASFSPKGWGTQHILFRARRAASPGLRKIS